MADAILPDMTFKGLTYELKIATFGIKNQHPSLSYYTSFKGRGFCIINTFGHGIGAVAKPLVYLVAAVVYSIIAIKHLVSGEDSKDYTWKALNSLGGILASPFSQVTLAVRAAFGAVFHPGIYFTKRPQFIDVVKDADPNNSRLTHFVNCTHGRAITQLELQFTKQTSIIEVKRAIAHELQLESNDTVHISGDTLDNQGACLEDDQFFCKYIENINIGIIKGS